LARLFLTVRMIDAALDLLNELGGRLEQLKAQDQNKGSIHRKIAHPVSPKKRRPYPAVLPKYRNPTKPSETWSGRGKQPKWLTVQLVLGKQLGDFRIATRGVQSVR
jgi:DNA-binding protein H-NS